MDLRDVFFFQRNGINLHRKLRTADPSATVVDRCATPAQLQQGGRTQVSVSNGEVQLHPRFVRQKGTPDNCVEFRLPNISEAGRSIKFIQKKNDLKEKGTYWEIKNEGALFNATPNDDYLLYAYVKSKVNESM